MINILDGNYAYYAEDNDASLDELIQDGEFQYMTKKKISRRFKVQNDQRERRLSRIVLGKEIALSKSNSI